MGHALEQPHGRLGYREGLTRGDKVVYYPTEDLGEEFKRFRAGELDVTYDTPSDQMKYVMANMKDQFQNSPYLGTYYYVINLTKEPFGKQRDVRPCSCGFRRRRFLRSVRTATRLSRGRMHRRRAWPPLPARPPATVRWSSSR